MRLSALSITGELTPDLQARLAEHLAECDECREAYEQDRQIAADLLPAIAAEIASEPEDAPGSDAWSVDRAQEKLFEALDKSASESNARKKAGDPKNRLVAIALLAIGGAAAIGYSAGRHAVIAAQGKIKAVSAFPAALLADPVAVQRATATADASLQEIKGLEKTVTRDRLQTTELRAELGEADARLRDQTDELTRSEAERDHVQQELSGAQEDAQALQSKLARSQSQTGPIEAKLQELEARIANLNQVIDEKDKVIVEDAKLLEYDRDVREVMGARNLYLAEIYDVAKNGATQKPSGRVFYTSDKSLIFYGFDLDKQQHLKDASVFQAWGREGTSRDVSLGILYLDDATKRRWALKVNDAQALARLDAVFITVEPKGGSVKPSGKPLLFTYLRIAPNHP